MRFSDPLHEIQGLTALQDYFTELYANVSELGFTFHGYDQVQDGIGYLRWTMHYHHPRLRRGQLIEVVGRRHRCQPGLRRYAAHATERLPSAYALAGQQGCCLYHHSAGKTTARNRISRAIYRRPTRISDIASTPATDAGQTHGASRHRRVFMKIAIIVSGIFRSDLRLPAQPSARCHGVRGE